MEQKLHTPISQETADSLTAGDYIFLSGTIYVARDAAHKRMTEALDRGRSFPFRSRTVLSTIWVPLRQGKEDRSALQDRQLPPVWTNTPRD